MNTKGYNNENRRQFIRILLIIALILFFILIKDYIIPLVLAVIFTGLLHPFYSKLLKRFKGKKTLASVTTLVLFLMLIVIPSVFLLWEIVEQAGLVSKQIFPVLEKQLTNSAATQPNLPDWMPFKEELEPYREQIFDKVSELIGSLSNLIIGGLSALTQGTFSFFLSTFVMLYALYYFLVSGKSILNKAHNYLPLTNTEFNLLANQVASISRATIKGAFLIGIIQGVLVGLGFWVCGIPAFVFWGSVAAVISVIPSVGTAVVYVPAGLYLIMVGNVGYGIGLLVWGFGVVSTVDNFLRPALVGKDVQMPDVLILVTTLGGIGLFGISGIVIGPLIAGLLMSLVSIYRNVLLNKNES
ncbi:MAG: AI-2E family transporter [Flavobacteriaceae bacterium]